MKADTLPQGVLRVLSYIARNKHQRTLRNKLDAAETNAVVEKNRHAGEVHRLKTRLANTNLAVWDLIREWDVLRPSLTSARMTDLNAFDDLLDRLTHIA